MAPSVHLVTGESPGCVKATLSCDPAIDRRDAHMVRTDVSGSGVAVNTFHGTGCQPGLTGHTHSPTEQHTTPHRSVEIIFVCIESCRLVRLARLLTGVLPAHKVSLQSTGLMSTS